MVLIEQCDIFRQGQGEIFLDIMVAVVCGNNIMPGKNAVGIGINHKNRFIACIEQDAVRGFGTDPFNSQDFLPQGIHILGKKPTRPVADDVRDKVKALAAYGVAFHACGNTMNSLKWTKEDMLPFANIVQIGVDDIMLLQEQGFQYFSW